MTPTPQRKTAMTLKEARKYFKENIAPKLPDQGRATLDTAFNDWTDSLAKNGEITERQYNTWCRT
jgi:hypothetical protein